MSYIHYDEKPNGAIYACIYESYRDKGKVKPDEMKALVTLLTRKTTFFGRRV